MSKSLKTRIRELLLDVFLRRDPILSLCHKTERYNFYHGHGVRLVVALRTIHAAE